jgi:hypothetical protein
LRRLEFSAFPVSTTGIYGVRVVKPSEIVVTTNICKTIFMVTLFIYDIKHFYCPTNAHNVKKRRYIKKVKYWLWFPDDGFIGPKRVGAASFILNPF